MIKDLKIPGKAGSETGFTLVEIIIIIVIVGILAVVAIPRYIDMNDRARAVACKHNQAVIESACVLYYSDEAIQLRTPRYPNALTDLVPRFLSQMPVCPTGGNYTANYVSASGSTSCSTGNPLHSRY
jgi:type II secretory pathway pseudopilin PulG